MAINYNDNRWTGKYVFLPRIGETTEFDIVEIYEVKSDNAKLNFSENTPVMQNGIQVVDDDNEPVFKKKDLGYHLEASLKSGKILSITSLPAFLSVFKKNDIKDGEHIKIEHIAKGNWKVERL